MQGYREENMVGMTDLNTDSDSDMDIGSRHGAPERGDVDYDVERRASLTHTRNKSGGGAVGSNGTPRIGTPKNGTPRVAEHRLSGHSFKGI